MSAYIGRRTKVFRVYGFIGAYGYGIADTLMVVEVLRD